MCLCILVESRLTVWYPRSYHLYELDIVLQCIIKLLTGTNYHCSPHKITESKRQPTVLVFRFAKGDRGRQFIVQFCAPQSWARVLTPQTRRKLASTFPDLFPCTTTTTSLPHTTPRSFFVCSTVILIVQRQSTIEVRTQSYGV